MVRRLDLHGTLRIGFLARRSPSLVLLHDRLYFVKGRLTLGEQALSIRETSELLQTFLSDLLDRTTLTSTGGCWMPIPIVRKDAPLPAKNPEALFTIDQKGVGVEAVAYKDRIEVLDVNSSQAKVTQMACAKSGSSTGCRKVRNPTHRIRCGRHAWDWVEVRSGRCNLSARARIQLPLTRSPA